MFEETKNNSGGLFKNQFKKTDRSPDMTGKCIIDGKEIRISAWDRMTVSGNPFLSLSFTSEEDFQKITQENKSNNNNENPNSLDNQLPEEKEF